MENPDPLLLTLLKMLQKRVDEITKIIARQLMSLVSLLEEGPQKFEEGLRAGQHRCEFIVF
jgi:hypothetical protein